MGFLLPVGPVWLRIDEPKIDELLSCPVHCPGLDENGALEPTDIPVSGRITALGAGERSRRSTRLEVTLGLLCLAHVVLGEI